MTDYYTKSRNNNVVVISADTDLLILPIHVIKELTYKLFFLLQNRFSYEIVPKVWDIDDVKSKHLVLMCPKHIGNLSQGYIESVRELN